VTSRPNPINQSTTQSNSQESFALALLQSEGYAAFEYSGDGNARPMAQPPAFLGELLGEQLKSSGPAATDSTLRDSVRLGDAMPFLENFLFDAETFWDSETQGRIESGMWTERTTGGREISLDATALWLDGKRILLVRNPQAKYAADARVLQTARDSLLEHERLLREIQKKEILLHCIVHDLSQPLTAMRGCFSVLKMQPLGDKLKTLVEIGSRQSHTQEMMIRGILEAFSSELAAQEKFDQAVKDAPDVANVAEAIAKDYSPAFAEHGAAIQLDPKIDRETKWEVVGDETRLRRIFTNLVENALRYSPKGTTVTLGADDEGEFIRAFVDDEGPGLPETDGPTRMFTLFGKGKTGGGKAGLGLYFCKITVERWGGTIGCEPRSTKGTRFWFRLPRARQDSGDASEATTGATHDVVLEATHATSIDASEAEANKEPARSQESVVLEPPNFDTSTLLACVGGNKQIAQQLIRAYLPDSGMRMSAIRDAIAQHDAPALARAAQALRGSIRSFGAKNIAETVRKLDEMGRSGHLEDAKSLSATLEVQLAQLDNSLRAFAG
jgi:signal transduction histidine kinase/HPt (histidine-containing phosphotransfer) domain-containing protein